jgi:Glu-tRNA(Gln) amidotransferase subunit E-like FAD-binding protein
MIVFLLIGFLVLMCIYFFMRAQMLQKDLFRYKQILRSSDNQTKFVLRTLVSVSGELQKTYVSRLNAANKHGLLSATDFEVASFILSNVEHVIMQCCEHKTTVEEAVIRALRISRYSMDDVSQFIARQPTEIKVSWSRNRIAGFIIACHNISMGRMNTTSADAGVVVKEAN